MDAKIVAEATELHSCISYNEIIIKKRKALKKEINYMEQQMFCFQCQETAGNKGCTKVGVCGKSADLANMQDLLIYVTKGLSEITTRLRKEGKTVSKELNHYITLNLFTTITNANFDDEVFYVRVKETVRLKMN